MFISTFSRRVLFLISTCIALTACDYYSDWTDEVYEVHTIDGHGNRKLARIAGRGVTIGRVGPQVIALGFNDKYLVAKRLHNDKITVSYYIVDKTRDGKYKDASEVTEGPFTLEAFQKLKLKRNLPEFTEQFTQY